MLPVPNYDGFQKQLDDLRKSYAQIQPQSIPAPRQIKYVDGMNGAKEYQSSMLPGESDIVMDKNEDIFYVVSKDSKNESPKLMTFGRFVLETEEAPESKYMTKDDFREFEQRVMAMLQNKEAKE